MEALPEADIVGLNNRLARYIDTVRQLERRKETLTKKLKKVKEIRSIEQEERDKEKNTILNDLQIRLRIEQDGLENAKDICEREVKENMRLVGLIQKQGKTLKNMKNKNNRLTKNVNEQTSVMKELDLECGRVKEEVSKLKDGIKKHDVKIKEILNDFLTEQSNMDGYAAQLEALKKENNVKAKNISKTRRDTTKRKFRKEIEGKNIDAEQHFQACLKDMRNKALEDMEGDIESIEKIQTEKLNELEEDLCDAVGESSKNKELLKNMIRREKEASKSLMILEDKCAKLQEDIHSANYLTETQKKEQDESKSQKNHEIERLKNQLCSIKSDQRKLMAEKIALDLEVAAYMKMIDLEEDRIKGKE